jgi:hypothetical protein
MLQIGCARYSLGLAELPPCEFAIWLFIMHLIRIIVPSFLACNIVWAQPVVPRSASVTEASRPVTTDGAMRRNELKAVLRSNGHEAEGGSAAMDASQRQQLRRQLREQTNQQ